MRSNPCAAHLACGERHPKKREIRRRPLPLPLRWRGGRCWRHIRQGQREQMSSPVRPKLAERPAQGEQGACEEQRRLGGVTTEAREAPRHVLIAHTSRRMPTESGKEATAAATSWSGSSSRKPPPLPWAVRPGPDACMSLLVGSAAAQLHHTRRIQRAGHGRGSSVAFRPSPRPTLARRRAAQSVLFGVCALAGGAATEEDEGFAASGAHHRRCSSHWHSSCLPCVCVPPVPALEP